MTLLLNGVAQTLVFNTNGPTQQLLATNTTPLATNVQYSATDHRRGRQRQQRHQHVSVSTRCRPIPCGGTSGNFGAVGDGVTMDTAAIQAAINACPSNGFVWLHNGTFLSGTIYSEEQHDALH